MNGGPQQRIRNWSRAAHRRHSRAAGGRPDDACGEGGTALFARSSDEE